MSPGIALVAGLGALAFSLLTSCAGGPPVPATAQAAVDAQAAVIEGRIARLCVGSGLFVMLNSAVTSAVPVPGLALAAQLVNAGVDRVCAAPAMFAHDASTVEWLIKNGLKQRSASMMKAVATDPRTGKSILMIGLSFGNLDKFRADPGDTFIKIVGEEVGLPVDVIIFSGETEQAMARQFADKIGPDTQARIDPRVADA